MVAANVARAGGQARVVLIGGGAGWRRLNKRNVLREQLGGHGGLMVGVRLTVRTCVRVTRGDARTV